MKRKIIINNIIKILLIVCILGMLVCGTIFTISYVRFPATTLYKIGHTIYYETGVLLPDISLKSIEKEYSLIKNGNYENEQEYLEMTLTVSMKMFYKCLKIFEYDKALTYYEFAKSKITDIDIDLKDSSIYHYFPEIWFCYVAAGKQQELFDDYANSIARQDEKMWGIVNSGFAMALISDKYVFGDLSFEERKPYIEYLMNEAQKIIDTTDDKNRIHKVFYFLLEKMSEYMSEHQD